MHALRPLIAVLVLGCSQHSPDPIRSLAGDSLYARGEFGAARAAWRGELASTTLADQRRAHLLTSVGLASYHIADYEEAERVADSALDIEHAHGINGAELFRTENALGLIAWNRGHLSVAETRFQDAVRTARSINDTASIAKALANIGLVLTDYADFQAARSAFLEAQAASHSIGDSRTEGNAHTNLAMVALRMGDLSTAEEQANEGLRLYHQTDFEIGEQNALGQLATVEAAKGNPRAAFAAIDSAMTIVRRHGLKQEEASDLEILGDLYAEAGDLRAAAHYYDQSQQLFAASKIELEAANVLRDRAAVDAALADTVSARERAHRARLAHHGLGAIGEELDDRFLEIELAANDNVGLDRELDEADSLARSIGSAPARVQSALERATVLERRGKSQQALSRLASVRTLLRESGAEYRWQDDALRARAFAQLALLDSAEQAGREAISIIEHVQSGYQSGPLRTAYAARQNQVYADLVAVLLREGKTAAAFETADAARGRATTERLSSAHRQGERKSTAGSVLQATSLRAQIDTLAAHLEATENGDSRGGGGGGGGSDQRVIQRDLRDRLTRARTEYEALLARADVGDGAELVGLMPTRAARVQGSLVRDEALLTYTVAQDTLFTFVLRRDTILAFSTAQRRADLGSQVRVLRDLLQQPTTNGRGAAAAEALYDLLIEPAVRSGLLDGVSRLLIVPDGVLTYLPFAALQDHRDGRFLIERHLLTFLPSAAALPVMRSRDQSATRTPWPPRSSVALAPFPRDLPASAMEAERFRARLPSATALIDNRATEHALRESLAAGGVVHIASHAELNRMNPMFSEIRLAPGVPGANDDDGRLQLFEVFGLEIRSPLVFLSGCETGVGAASSSDVEQGEDYATLARAFLFAGARDVVATLWRIDDAGAAELADRFYAHLPAASPTEALALAQREMLRQTRYAAAYYWAGYQVSGAEHLGNMEQ